MILKFCTGFTTGVAAYHTYLTDKTDAHKRLVSHPVFKSPSDLPFCIIKVAHTFPQHRLPFHGNGYRPNIWKPSHTCYRSYSLRLRRLNTAVGLLRRVKRTFAFLSPLTLFMPSIGKSYTNALRKPRRDWTLTLLAITYGITISVMVSSQCKARSKH